MKKFYLAAMAISMATIANADIIYTVNPAPGEVKELETIEIIGDSRYLELESLSMGDLGVMKDGKFFSGIRYSALGSAPKLTITLKNPATEPGTYTLTIPKDSFLAYSDDYATETMNDEVTLTYTIKRVVTDTGLDFTTVPAEGETIESLSKVTLNANPDLYSSISRTATEVLFNVLKDGRQFTTASCGGSGLSWEFTLETPATEAGEYTLEIPGGSFSATKKGHSSPYNVTDTYSLKFKVVPPAGDVVYDLEVYGTKPGEGNELDLSLSNFDVFIYSSHPTFYADPDKEWVKPAHDAKVKIVANDGSWEGEADLKYSFQYQMWAQFKSPKYDGEYTMTIPSGSYGDADWQKDATKGHANKEYTCTFKIVGLGTPGGVVFNLEPDEITPTREIANDLSVITVRFPKGTKVKEGTTGTLSSTVVMYTVSTPVVEIGDGLFELRFEPAPSEPAVYSFIIEKGAFGDEEYMADNTKGVSTQAIGWAWDFNPAYPGPDAVIEIGSEEAENVVFDLFGRKIADTKANLPGGIYIVNRKKVIVK